MKFEELSEKINRVPIFNFNDLLKWFPKTNPRTLKLQLHNWLKIKKLLSLKKGLYYYPKIILKDIFLIAPKLYFPSYISVETALNYYGIIPDVPQKIISVTTLATTDFKTPLANFTFRKIKTSYFFGYKTIKDKSSIFFYNIARPEKALIDFLYFNLPLFQNAEDLKAQRFNFDDNFDWKIFINISKIFNGQKLEKLCLDIQKLYA